MGWRERFGFGPAPAPALSVGPNHRERPGIATEAHASRLDSVLNALTGLGTAADKGTAGMVNPFVARLQDHELATLWEHNGIAHRIVALLPDEATRKGWTVPDLDQEEQDLSIHHQVHEAMTWGRLYGGSILVMVTEDDIPPAFRQNPSAWLREPLDLERVGKVRALQVFDALQATPGLPGRDITSPHYRQPAWWDLSTDRGTLRVHASRVLHFRGSPRSPSRQRSVNARMPDDSVLQRVWDEVYRLTSTMQGGAVLAQEIRESVLRVAGLENVATGDQESKLTDRIRLMARAKGLLGMVVLGPGDEYSNRANPPTGFSELSGEARTMLAGVVGWPQIVLYGEAPGGLSTDGSSGWQLMNRITSAYQETHRPLLERLYATCYAAQDGSTSGTGPEDHYLTFLDIDEPGIKEQAEAREITARTDMIYINTGVLDPSDIRQSRFGEEGWQLDLRELDAHEADPDFAELAPEPVDPTSTPTALATGDVQASALNGSQVSSALGILERVATRRLPRETGVAALQRFFFLPVSEAEAIMGPVGSTFFVEAAAVTAQVTDAVRRLDAAMVHRGAFVFIPAPRVTSPVPLDVAEEQPHVTVLYLGVVDPSDHAELVQVVAEEARRTEPGSRLAGGRLSLFPHGQDGTPVVVEFDPWPLVTLHERLLRRLAHLVSARQHPTFRPHLTLGYVTEAQGPDERHRLASLPVDATDVLVEELVVRAGDVELARLPIGG